MSWMPISDPNIQRAIYGQMPWPWPQVGAQPPAGPPRPVTPQTMSAPPASEPQAQSRLGRLWQLLSSPQGQAFFMSAGSSMMQPRGFGESRAGHWLNSINSGMAGVGYMREYYRQLAEQQRKAGLEAQQVQNDTTRAQAAATQAETDKTRAAALTKQGERRLDIDERAEKRLANFANADYTYKMEALQQTRQEWQERKALLDRELNQKGTQIENDRVYQEGRLAVERTANSIRKMEAQTQGRLADFNTGAVRAVPQLIKTAKDNARQLVQTMANSISGMNMTPEQMAELETKFYNQTIEQMKSVYPELKSVVTGAEPKAGDQSTNGKATAAPATSNGTRVALPDGKQGTISQDGNTLSLDSGERYTKTASGWAPATNGHQTTPPTTAQTPSPARPTAAPGEYFGRTREQWLAMPPQERAKIAAESKRGGTMIPEQVRQYAQNTGMSYEQAKADLKAKGVTVLEFGSHVPGAMSPYSGIQGR